MFLLYISNPLKWSEVIVAKSLHLCYQEYYQTLFQLTNSIAETYSSQQFLPQLLRPLLLKHKQVNILPVDLKFLFPDLAQFLPPSIFTLKIQVQHSIKQSLQARAPEESLPAKKKSHMQNGQILQNSESIRIYHGSHAHFT